MTTLSTPTHRDHRPDEGRPMTTKQAAERYALIAAGVVIVALTAGGFWLSYAHLAEVAGQHGLKSSPVRQWAWPATLDAFIVAGELLMLRAGLRRVTDGWAIALTATGSVGSIALNVAGVSGTGNTGTVPLLDYVVAAVPPTAALLAFGVLMRQIHQLVDQPADHFDAVPVQAPISPVTAPAEPSAEPVRPTEPPAAGSGQPTKPPPEVSESKPRGGRPPKATLAELVEIGRIALAEHGTLSRSLLRKTVKDRNLTIGSQRQTEVMEMLRPEIEAAAKTGSSSG
ncbi:DUF2637 domain-containing protein [Streptomyces ipomoeae]|uniref:DUF2637 domain-containing protein n=1 Tax=Streptomyces ipomoeae 91-03 TaxID=698759 RepID=L1KQF0_9ACTN|nr:DUF2637 domain-containing protein [Streptomyces ipomoeae]EKX62613.1 hypothetical protein STRIP9103_04500 [Streptomyces ipomoeae 91-03]MDX2697752.1 DUF2637 domain-containing protein [Streptomyces ipomoeae]MDX2839478.1 DUF2637 domain-containing protein [Streptomyces ipomoeae]